MHEIIESFSFVLSHLGTTLKAQLVKSDSIIFSHKSTSLCFFSTPAFFLLLI